MSVMIICCHPMFDSTIHAPPNKLPSLYMINCLNKIGETNNSPFIHNPIKTNVELRL